MQAFVICCLISQYYHFGSQSLHHYREKRPELAKAQAFLCDFFGQVHVFLSCFEQCSCLINKATCVLVCVFSPLSTMSSLWKGEPTIVIRGNKNQQELEKDHTQCMPVHHHFRMAWSCRRSTCGSHPTTLIRWQQHRGRGWI